MEVIVKYHGDIEGIAGQLDGKAEVLSFQYAILTIDAGRLTELYGFSEIEDIEMPERLYTDTAFALSVSCISRVQSGIGGMEGLLGQGVLIGIIDSGIDYTHPDFRNEDGSTRILSLWDQTVPGRPPEGFSGGSEYTREDIDQALRESDPFRLVPSRDRAGHGTAVAGIAAGNGRASSGQTKGAAPGAGLLAVRAGGNTGDSFALSTQLMRALRYVIDRAREVGRPLSVNLSYGMNSGSHQGTSLFEEYIAAVASEWKTVIVTPTGNEGDAGHHVSGRLVGGQMREVPFFTAEGLTGFSFSLWKNFVDRFSVELVSPDGRRTGQASAENPVQSVRDGSTVLTVRYGEPTRYSVDQEVRFAIAAESGTIKAGVWRILLNPVNITDGRFDIWLPTTEQVTASTYFSSPSIYNTMTLPATAGKVIRVAGYNDQTGSIASFSGVGDRTDTLRMPDLAAPAVNIRAARPGGTYGYYTGTSFAAPFVTGSAALLMEWSIVRGNDPFLYGERIRAYLRYGAARSSGMDYPNPHFGYGRLCLESALLAAINQ